MRTSELGGADAGRTIGRVLAQRRVQPNIPSSAPLLHHKRELDNPSETSPPLSLEGMGIWVASIHYSGAHNVYCAVLKDTNC